MYMEAVFSGGDIVKQLPQEAKRFQNIDKNYMVWDGTKLGLISCIAFMTASPQPERLQQWCKSGMRL